MPVTRAAKATRWGGKPSAASRRGEILAMHRGGMNSVEIAAEIGVSEGRIRQILGEARRLGYL